MSRFLTATFSTFNQTFFFFYFSRLLLLQLVCSNMSESYFKQPPEIRGEHVAEGYLTYIYGGQRESNSSAYKREHFFSFKNTTFLCAAQFYDVLRGGNWFLLMWLLNVSANRTSFDLKGLIDLTVAGEGMSEKRRGSFLLCQQVHLSRSGLIDLDRDACLLTTYHGWASLCTDWRYRGTFLFFYPKSGSMPFDNLSMSICWNKKKEGKSCQKNSNSH